MQNEEKTITGRAASRNDSLRVAAYVARSRVNGPGVRAVVWVQGCPFRCPGCFNPEFQPFAGGSATSAGALAERILADPDTEGVTVSGGEPFAQAAALACVAEIVRGAGRSVLVFTGYPWSELQASAEPAHQALLAQTDVLVAGPYQQDNTVRHALLASANQELVFLTDRYTEDDVGPPQRRVEIQIDREGTRIMTGFPVGEAETSNAALRRSAFDVPRSAFTLPQSLRSPTHDLC